MERWKKVVAIGALGTGAALALSGRRSLGLASVAGGVALLATEYPDKFEAIWNNTPDYVRRASEVFATLSHLAAKFADETRRRGVLSFDEAV